MKLGITGHQDLGAPPTQDWVRRQLIRQVSMIEPDHGYTSLARGADQVFASVLLERSVPYTVIIPSRSYEQTFGSPSGLDAYRSLLAVAHDRIELDNDELSEAAFLEAGEKILDLVDILIAVWDGKPAQGRGGTGDIVELARLRKKSVIHVDLSQRVTRHL